MEDSTGCIHGSRGVAEPAGEHLRSEPWIVAELAKATLPPNPQHRLGWLGRRLRPHPRCDRRDLSEDLHGLNERMWQPGGFHRPLPARHREWKTESGKANFIAPKPLAARAGRPFGYSSSPRFAARASSTRASMPSATGFAAIDGTRMVLFMNKRDIDRLALAEGATVSSRHRRR